MYFILFQAVASGTVDCTLSKCGACLPCHHSSHSQLLEEQISTSQVNMTTEVLQKFSRQQERCSSRHHGHTQNSIDTSDSNGKYGHSLGSQCLIVTKTEGHGLIKLDLLYAQTSTLL